MHARGRTVPQSSWQFSLGVGGGCEGQSDFPVFLTQGTLPLTSGKYELGMTPHFEKLTKIPSYYLITSGGEVSGTRSTETKRLFFSEMWSLPHPFFTKHVCINFCWCIALQRHVARQLTWFKQGRGFCRQSTWVHVPLCNTKLLKTLLSG